MRTMTQRDRRRFLRLLAASPVVSLLDLPSLIAQQSGSTSSTPDLIATVGDALNVFDFEAIARSKLPPWHWAWMSNGADMILPDGKRLFLGSSGTGAPSDGPEAQK